MRKGCVHIRISWFTIRSEEVLTLWVKSLRNELLWLTPLVRVIMHGWDEIVHVRALVHCYSILKGVILGGLVSNCGVHRSILSHYLFDEQCQAWMMILRARSPSKLDTPKLS